ncbi:VWA domain-containing protein [Cocleimonas sp. KMM 6892]|uniref:vWA domain-containing protein n=1 Tax=unclassified Cocleimonas TaxID=2639732 RepID=UPI002DBFC1A6|nr:MULTISPECIES: VWA domain-containing protein [unclassified Cocleimonas]MEB8432635.1 VWA domain-containing protein [Cocleimonas sp. KMM 6892]MEC4715494.1 VWA domain-containing protein [Cocleimonas sp. KMM 6895]MEC4744888.1 VWA domain-containing protein [Cocleimonas sp. KMM 6896]
MSRDFLSEIEHSSTAEILQGRLIEFIQIARNNGYQAGISEVIDAQEVAHSLNITQPQYLRWGLRSLLCSNQNDWQRFDDLFDAYWLPSAKQNYRTESVAGAPVGKRESVAREAEVNDGEATDVDQAGQGEGDDAFDGGALEGASGQESLFNADFQFITDAKQMSEVDDLVERLAKKMRRRIIRRQKIQAKGRRIDIRKTVRKSLRYGGMPMDLAFRNNRKNQPRLIIIIDVSRSMSLYSYVFLRFARGIVSSMRDADAFAFHTRMVHITGALHQPNLTKVKTKLSLISAGWSGGTRIGECLDSFLNNYRHRLNSHTVVMVVSDGLDTGEPEFLANKLATIRSQCRKVIWLNPLLGRPGYEPKTGSMLAALPFIDLFASAHNVESLSALEPELMRI